MVASNRKAQVKNSPKAIRNKDEKGGEKMVSVFFLFKGTKGETNKMSPLVCSATQITKKIEHEAPFGLLKLG